MLPKRFVTRGELCTQNIFMATWDNHHSQQISFFSGDFYRFHHITLCWTCTVLVFGFPFLSPFFVLIHFLFYVYPFFTRPSSFLVIHLCATFMWFYVHCTKSPIYHLQFKSRKCVISLGYPYPCVINFCLHIINLMSAYLFKTFFSTYTCICASDK